MKNVSFILVAFMITAFLGSCKKEDGASAADIAKANEFKAFVASKNWQIADYYSDKPIDYDEEDSVVKSETDLFKYVSKWIKDDLNNFDLSTNKVTIQQNLEKIEGNTDATIVKDISVTADKTGAIFNFLNYQYQPLKYHIVEFTADYFIVYAEWHSGAKVFTKFVIIP